MRKCVAILTSLCLLFGLAGCGSNTETTAAATEAATTEAATTEAASAAESAAADTTAAAVQEGVALAIQEHAGSAQGLKVALSNSILTNAWRIQMIKILRPIAGSSGTGRGV